MTENTSDLLTKVETALWLGDQRLAGMLLHKVLTQDFTNRQAWLLLHGMRGEGKTLEEFQHSFAAKYYPHLAHLLDQPPVDSPPQTEPATPDALPVADLPIETSKFCAECGTKT